MKTRHSSYSEWACVFQRNSRFTVTKIREACVEKIAHETLPEIDREKSCCS